MEIVCVFFFFSLSHVKMQINLVTILLVCLFPSNYSRYVGLLARMHLNICLGVVTDYTSIAVSGNQFLLIRLCIVLASLYVCVLCLTVNVWLLMLVVKF